MPIATCLLDCFNTAVMELIRWPTNYMFTIMIFIKKVSTGLNRGYNFNVADSVNDSQKSHL